jgi:hypothetical protein
LQRSITVHAAKVEVALCGHIGYVGRYSLLLAQFPDARRGVGVINGAKYHICSFKIFWLKCAIDMRDLALRYTESDFIIET